MEIILKQDVNNLGHKHDIVSVRPGYANNFLIPEGMAVVATDSAKKMLAEDIKQFAHKESKLIENANAQAEKLNAVSLSIAVKSEEGKIYGSVTAMQIAEALVAKGFEVDRKSIVVDPVKTIGNYTAQVKVYKDIKATVSFEVVAE